MRESSRTWDSRVDYPELSMPLSELVLRGTVIYFVIAFVVRVLPKRSIGNNSPIDMLALITMGALVADAMSVDPSIRRLLVLQIVAAWDWALTSSSTSCPGSPGSPRKPLRDRAQRRPHSPCDAAGTDHRG